jgi:hypothetical protein
MPFAPTPARFAWMLSAALMTLALDAAAQNNADTVDYPTRVGLAGAFALEPQSSAGLPLVLGMYIERLVWRGLSLEASLHSLNLGGNEGERSSYRSLMFGSSFHPWPNATIDPWAGIGFGWWHETYRLPSDSVGVEHVVDAAAAGATLGVTAAFGHGGVGLHGRLVKAFTTELSDTWSEVGLHAEFRF